MTLSAADRAAISPQNGQKSQGTKTPEGNALKQGFTAKLPLLPGEDAQEYQARLDAWIAALQPRNVVEHYLVVQAVNLTWKLDRARRAETARLAMSIREAAAERALREQDEALVLGRRLLHGCRGPLP
jgi:hypothetical protein